MTLRGFFMGRAVVFTLLLVLGIGVYAYKAYRPSDQTSEVAPPEAPESVESSEPPTFTWRFGESESLNLDGLPETDVFLEAKYSGGAVQSKLIDTTPGSCNALPDPDAGSIPGSDTIQCYSAGLGYRFKVTRGESSYLVQRKTFEEASPDYDPPSYEYEVVAEFSL